MKQATKYKIINIIKRIIRFKEPEYVSYKEEIKKIYKIECELIVKEGELENLKRRISYEFAKELESSTIIKYKKEKAPFGGYVVRAQALFIT